MKKLKVLIACDTFAPDINGAARFAERLAGGLARRGHEIHIIAPAKDRNHGSGIEVHDGVELMVHRIKSHKLGLHPTHRLSEPWAIRSKVTELIRSIRPDALHVQSHLVIGRFAIQSARALGVRTLATNHTMPENLIKYSGLPKWAHGTAMKIIWADAGRILKRMDSVTTPTRRAADLLEKATGLSGVLAVSCGIDAKRFANTTPTQNSDPLLLFVGRLDYEKRIHVLLEAVALLKDHPLLKVELVGDGSERQSLKDLAEKLGVGERVRFRGHVEDSKLAGVYESCTAFVMPSIAELQSIATMEAMASGRPVIAANAMALPHLVHDGDNGYLFEADNPVDLAAKLELVLNADQQELDRLSENSLHLIQSHDINNTLDIFERLYVGQGTASSITADNNPDYHLPIGRLSEAVAAGLAELREDAVQIRRRAELFGAGAREFIDHAQSEAREKFEELSHEVREQIADLKDDIARQVKKLRDRGEK